MPDSNPGLMTIFTEALARPDPAERVAYMDRACGGDAELRRRVEELLAAHLGMGRFLEPAAATSEDPTHLPPEATAAFEPEPQPPTELLTGASHPAPFEEAPPASPATEPATSGVIAGRYTLVEVIGEGGMGSVYLAEQTDPVKRQVALKLIKSGMDSKAVLARFEAERQALALMDHPNIARVYDGGVTPPTHVGGSPMPFFVMELVRGMPLTDYCDQHRLPVRARLELFVSVCQAVQHAHQKGIIHRDLKPSNVLVTEVDGRPTPKVIDFGVAKATEARLTDMSYSDTGAIVGTPAYMSPEQADPSSMDIDTRTDVYALGVILYELLVGSPPIDARQFKRGAILEMLRMVREVDPPRPSTKLSAAKNLPNVAANRAIEPARLAKSLRGELDWVVMKALEKDRTRRYETASGLARDVERYLADEPVHACPPSRWYRLRKVLRRHRLPVLAAALVVLALVAGVVGTTTGLLQAVAARDSETRQRQEADKARKDAEDERDSARFEARRAESARHAIQIELAQRAWERGDVSVAERVLDEAAEPFRQTWEQRYLRALCRRKARPLPGQEGDVADMAMSADGRLVAAAGADKLKVWDAETGKERFTLKGHAGPVLCVAVSADGRRIVSGSEDNTIRVWDASSGKPLFTLQGHKGAVDAVGISADGRSVVSGSVDATVKTWDAVTGKLIWTKEGIPGNGVAISPDGKLVARGHDRPIVWEVATGVPLPPFQGPVGTITSLAFTPDGRRLVSATFDCAVQVWDLKTGKEQRRWVTPFWQIHLHEVGQGGALTRVAVGGGGKRVIAAGWGRTARVWDIDTGDEKFSLQGHPEGHICRSVAISTDGARAVTASERGDIRVWDLLATPESRTLRGHKNWVAAVALSADGRLAVSGGGFSEDGNIAEVKVWDADTGELKHNLLMHLSVRAVAISRDGQRVVCGNDEGAIRAWDARTGREQYTRKAHADQIHTVALSPDGRRIASGSRDHTVKVFDADTGAERLTYRGHAGEHEGVWDIQGVCFSPDGRFIASGSDQGFVRVWDADTGEEKLTPLSHKECISCLAWSADGKYIVSGGGETIKIWNAASGEELRTLTGRSDWFFSLCISPDGRRIISGGREAVRLWDVETGQQKLSLAGHQDWVAGVAISEDGRRVVSASSDRTVKVWEAPPLFEK